MRRSARAVVAFIFALCATEFRMVFVGRKGIAVEREGEFEHAGADGRQIALGVLQCIVRFDAALDSIDRFVAALKQDLRESDSTAAYLEVARKLLAGLREYTSASFRADYTQGEVLFLKKQYGGHFQLLQQLVQLELLGLLEQLL